MYHGQTNANSNYLTVKKSLEKNCKNISSQGGFDEMKGELKHFACVVCALVSVYVSVCMCPCVRSRQRLSPPLMYERLAVYSGEGVCRSNHTFRKKQIQRIGSHNLSQNLKRSSRHVLRIVYFL